MKCKDKIDEIETGNACRNVEKKEIVKINDMIKDY